MTQPLTRRFFAASNSCLGFRNYYGDLFTDTRTDRLYIIKGGPGTGKSHFMKVVARHARNRGYAVTEYACSSDPASLDGLMLTRDGSPTLGFLDGTAPHVREPVLPGVREEMVNLGAFWNSRLLAGQSETVRTLTTAKATAYDRAYAYLAACGQVDRAAESMMAGCVRQDRLHSLADRILRHLPCGEGYTPVPALRRAVGMTGEVCLHTFEADCAAVGGTLLVAEDYYGLGYHLTAALHSLSMKKRQTVLVSYHPVYPNKIDGLYYPESGLCVLVGHAEPPEGAVTRTVTLRRYAHAEALRSVRGELRHAQALRERLMDSVLRELSSASRAHFELEKIYSAAMDFRAKEAFTESFCAALFDQ